jgi:hypothetical protein
LQYQYPSWLHDPLRTPEVEVELLAVEVVLATAMACETDSVGSEGEEAATVVTAAAAAAVVVLSVAEEVVVEVDSDEAAAAVAVAALPAV